MHNEVIAALGLPQSSGLRTSLDESRHCKCFVVQRWQGRPSLHFARAALHGTHEFNALDLFAIRLKRCNSREVTRWSGSFAGNISFSSRVSEVLSGVVFFFAGYVFLILCEAFFPIRDSIQIGGIRDRTCIFRNNLARIQVFVLV